VANAVRICAADVGGVYRWDGYLAQLVAMTGNLPPAYAAAARYQTHTIPIIFVTISDPVGSGFVASFARPGRNATGFVTADALLGGKWLELLKEIAPHVRRVAAPFNPATTHMPIST
jgi:putative tryptophan/tyrosine transport system substrate-binding protein